MKQQLSDYRVLVVDGRTFQCSQMAAVLQTAGFSPADVAVTAEIALEMISMHFYHLVLIDLNVPGMDGLGFLDRLATLDKNPMLAIISECPRRIVNGVSLMAKEKGMAVMGTFTRPLTWDSAKQLANQLCQGRENSYRSSWRVDIGGLLDRGSLEHALSHGQLCAWFQPKKALTSGRIVSAEALPRWQHPNFGFMLPGSFLSAVRRHALDRILLLRMLGDALEAHSRWRREGFRMPVSVNLPPHLLDDPAMPDELERIVLARGVSPQDISFELLEDETEKVEGQFYKGACELRLKGFGLAQDDFGIGYSSMYRLISVPFSELKIDRAIVKGVADDESRAAAVLSTVQLGRQLGLHITAEGVETGMDLEFVRAAGCDFAQGFLIAPAMDARAFSDLLAVEWQAMGQFPS